MYSADHADRARYAIDLDQYLILTSSLSVFLWQVLYAGIINFYLGYVIILFNSALLFAQGALVIHRRHLLFLIVILVVSSLAAIITHNPIRAMVAQLVGISLFSIYHYSVFAATKFSLLRILKIYSGWANVAAIWGYPVWLIHKAQGDTLYRFHSWFAEPSHYVYATLPAASLYLLKWQRERKLSPAGLPLLISYIPADSSTAYIGLGITILLMSNIRSIKRIAFTALVCAIGFYAVYNLSDNFRLRVNDLLSAQIQSSVTNALNRSVDDSNPTFGDDATTFALVTNAYVAWQAFLNSPLIGNGLGTHTTSYGKYASDIVSPTFILWGLNRDDANSLILRLMSEMGLFGLFGVLFLILYFGRGEGVTFKLIRNAILPYFAMRLVRFGAYFSLENWFFIMIYAFNYIQYHHDRNLSWTRSDAQHL